MSDLAEERPDLDPNGEGSWSARFVFRGTEYGFPVTRELIEQEVRDQLSIKGSQRKAIVRATEKKVARDIKIGVDNLQGEKLKDFEWNLFILFVDDVIAGRHVKMREDEAVFSAVMEDERFCDA
ncbi:hypothetical protein [Kiloniella sp. b19]|uniref:hypothetical protein n=1 Tax=Kiloniella sp. GXU_MW_B19 TaxID=3141326 RepID=UPI0031CDEBF9